MPVSATSLPLLTIAPSKVGTDWSWIALNAAEIVPALVMPPPVLLSPKTLTWVTAIPIARVAWHAVIVPRLTIPPESVVTPEILTPVLPAATTPLLTMPPSAVAPNTLTPLNAEIAPWLPIWMPPKTSPPLTRTPFAPKFAATILLPSTIAP